MRTSQTHTPAASAGFVAAELSARNLCQPDDCAQPIEAQQPTFRSSRALGQAPMVASFDRLVGSVRRPWASGLLGLIGSRFLAANSPTCVLAVCIWRLRTETDRLPPTSPNWPAQSSAEARSGNTTPALLQPPPPSNNAGRRKSYLQLEFLFIATITQLAPPQSQRLSFVVAPGQASRHFARL